VAWQQRWRAGENIEGKSAAYLSAWRRRGGVVWHSRQHRGSAIMAAYISEIRQRREEESVSK